MIDPIAALTEFYTWAGITLVVVSIAVLVGVCYFFGSSPSRHWRNRQGP